MFPRSVETLEDRRAALEVLTALAHRAGAVLLDGYRRAGTRVRYKGAIDLVTEYDLASEAVLREGFSSQVSWDLVAEEHGGSPRGDRPVVYADPLDGTTNFAHGHPFFAVSLGMVTAGPHPEPLAGVVYAPALGWTWRGGPGLGAERNGVPCMVSETETLDASLLATGFPYDRRTSEENNLRAFAAMKMLAQGIRRCGSAALDLCLVADGTYDGYWEKKLKPWDLAGGIAIVLGAGGRSSNLTGGAMELSTGALVATNGKIHEELLRSLSRVSGEW